MQTLILVIVFSALAAKVVWECFLLTLNMREVNRRRHAPPEALREVMDEQTYEKSVQYTLAKGHFSLFSEVFGALLLVLVLLSGVLPWLYGWMVGVPDASVWLEGLFLILVFFLLSLPGLPLDYYAQFILEERFGFNKSTVALWISDRIKATIISVAIALPLLALILFLIDWIGNYWWFWAFTVFFVFQLLMMILYPMLILPWFNKLSPLPDGELRDRLMNLAERTGFKARTIQVMDGSKRSGHSNAFFTGFGRFRRIVLFDTLIEQLTEDELEAVLAHEIGHYKKGHVPKMLILSAVFGLAAFAVLAWLLNTPAFVEAFGFSFADSGYAPAFLLFALLAGFITFWLSPLMNRLSRTHEYQADRFARDHVGGPRPMISSLRKLSEKNLSNLTPHPLYSAFHYSHPTLLEREAALK
ncbi:STE24 endopeptidase [Desulfonatronum thiosulfatophilum]|uniref:STE24 endopeptidase n=1 Tax=Desulfonatronum thiosulfatophilum TaxID=617002 RepID=A0A1G6BYK1_9BACT|nr:M48 family metallopeptidase [Desulfonatronum thiosulfatophilum]SDB25711.1 STE24 endopeptidase [Desulfonatronum thiosulfatophilum]